MGKARVLVRAERVAPVVDGAPRRSMLRGHWKVVRIKQHASFAIYSTSVAADEVERLVGLQPDRVSVRGSRTTSPPRPVAHVWEVRCEERGLTVDEQVDRIVARLSPYRPAIRKVVDEIDDAHAVLGVVRSFGAWLADGDGEEEDLAGGRLGGGRPGPAGDRGRLWAGQAAA